MGFAPRLLRYLKSLTPNGADAEDALQEVFASLWKKLANPDYGDLKIDHPSAYLFTSARHALSRRTRLKAGQPRHTEDLDDLERLGLDAGWGDHADSEDLAARLESVHRLHEALGRLSPNDREVLVLRELEGFSSAEVASILQLELPAVKSRLLRARLRLAAQLKGVSS
jgi:RNA polymerase sigma-70 factor (ECF subfamily)